MYSIYRQCVTVGRGVERYCGPYSAGVLHSISDQIRNLQNCFTAPNKMTSEDDIKGLVSLKFLRPCVVYRRSWGERMSGNDRVASVSLILPSLPNYARNPDASVFLS
jgi:hypothetical protein